MRRSLLIALAGCGRIGFGGHDDTPIDAPADAAPDASTACLSDDFEDGTIDPRWMLLDPAQTFPVTELNGSLQISLASGTAIYNGLASVATYAFDATSSATIELVQPVSQAGFVDCDFAIVDAAGTRHSIGIGGGNTVFATQVSGQPADRVLVAYNPTAHRHLRLTYDGAMLHWETSADRITWMPGRVLAVAAPGNATIMIYAGAFQVGAADPGTAVWDRFRLSTPACP